MQDEGSNDDFGEDVPQDRAPALKGRKLRPEIADEGEVTRTSKVDDPTTHDAIQWGCVAKDLFTTMGSSAETLEPGVYTLEADHNGRIYFRLDHMKTDELLEFKDSLADQILAEIETFWDKKDAFKKYNFLHRRGYIFYGGAGGGKTSLVHLIMKRIIGRGGIVFMGNAPDLLSVGVRTFRNIEPDRHIVCIFEDIDAIINEYGDAKLLSFLDGENQVNDVLNIATTNYPERLDRRIICRPRRFDRRILISSPSEGTRREFFTRKLQVDGPELEEYVKASDRFTFAAMADLVIQVKCLDVPFEEAVKRIVSLLDKKKPTGDDDFGGKVGFAS